MPAWPPAFLIQGYNSAFITSTARGLSLPGSRPALSTSNLFPAICFKNASAICDLTELCTQMNKTLFYPWRAPSWINHSLVFKHILTKNSITGTSMSTPTTVANEAPEDNPKSIVGVAIATSKWLLAPIYAEGAAS